MSKKDRLYQLERPPFSSREFHMKFTNLVGPLSLFEPEDGADIGNENPEVERPLTPIEDAVKWPPSSFSALAKLVHPRLTPKEGIAGLSVSDQHQLIGILMNELNSIWQDVQRGPPDPFLTGQQNRELQRRLTIEIVVVVQGLFAKYLDKAQKLHQRGVFSCPANLSRLKTQLALEANKSLNVLSLRRNIAADIKHPIDTSTVSSKFSFGRAQPTPPPKPYRPLATRQGEDRKGKPYLTRVEKQQQWMDHELSDLQRQMPHLQSSLFQNISSQNLPLQKKSISDSVSISEENLSGERNDDATLNSLRQKFSSLPELFSRDAVLEELGVLPEDVKAHVLKRSQSESKLLEEETFDGLEDDKIAEKRSDNANHASRDLVKLLDSSLSSKPSEGVRGEEEYDDLPPLLQALARHSTRHKERDQKTQKRLKREVESKDNLDDTSSVTSTIGSTEASSVAVDPTIQEETITEFTGEEHPQPAVVSLRLPDKSVVRASDVRVSNRVNKASVTLKRYPTVYNDLIGEIDTPTVKWLDKNLFIGEEIKEVYEEITKTIGTDHLLFDQDLYVERTTETVDLTLCTSSSSLCKPRAERVMNNNLAKDIPPPWGNGTADNWRNSPKFGGLGREDILQAKLKKGDDNGHGNKSYNSWLAWWRSTITTDDFLKFLSTQENDYLSLLFHLYDSDHEADDGEDGDEARPDTVQMALLRERERKLAQLRLLKKDYQPGVWNVNSVLLGGLGNEPDVDEEELLANLEESLNIVTPDTSTKQTGGAATSPLSHSVGSAKSVSSMSNSDRQRVDTSSVGVIPQAVSSAGAETASTSEVGSLSPQDRLERLWTLLCMPDTQRLDMAIKYSAEPYSSNLLEAITFWEIATEVILDRESLMTKLEDFERTASDPNRFFSKENNGSSASRIKESKTRDWFNKRLTRIESQIKRSVTDVQRQFGDIVTFQGRPYLEKINLDRTEMFYWLQQERRQHTMDRELVKMREVTLNATDLPPIQAHMIL
ncbi:coiled-coil domain-containing protein 87 isoform X1 [Pocillopora verrucosa]|uniref:coiled-coil domain-containing protein 87 isoform X1 n=2 Tax=Pocillopora verrucosa TaxID=203993 RepID=UPI003341683D